MLAAGGIADGRAIRRALVAGASGVLMITRYASTMPGPLSKGTIAEMCMYAGRGVDVIKCATGRLKAAHTTLANPTNSRRACADLAH